ncbi:hypothetical protein NPIL_288861, partial [Nephila pilipes]
LQMVELPKTLNETTVKPPFEKFDPYNLAVKVMFNYSAESNAYAIWNAMYKETLPSIAEFSFSDDDERKFRL